MQPKWTNRKLIAATTSVVLATLVFVSSCSTKPSGLGTGSKRIAPRAQLTQLRPPVRRVLVSHGVDGAGDEVFTWDDGGHEGAAFG